MHYVTSEVIYIPDIPCPPIQVFYLNNPIDCSSDTSLHGNIEMIRQEKNKRLYNLKIDNAVDDLPSTLGIYEIP
jgi:hypothetical protein